MTYRKLSKRERKLQAFRNWVMEYSDQKFAIAGFLFLVTISLWFRR